MILRTKNIIGIIENIEHFKSKYIFRSIYNDNVEEFEFNKILSIVFFNIEDIIYFFNYINCK